jgi:hypothetical protein
LGAARAERPAEQIPDLVFEFDALRPPVEKLA